MVLLFFGATRILRQCTIVLSMLVASTMVSCPGTRGRRISVRARALCQGERKGFRVDSSKVHEHTLELGQVGSWVEVGYNDGTVIMFLLL